MNKLVALLVAGVVCCRPGPPPRLGVRVDAHPEFACTQAPPPDVHCPPEMALIPRGTPVLSRRAGSMAPRRVETFCIDRLEVTLGDYRTCVGKEQCRPPHPWPMTCRDAMRLPKFDPCLHVLDTEDASRDRHPINCIDYEDAMAFCQSRHKRLPTQDEWEYAARACDGRRYPWGKELPTPERGVINTNDTGPVGTHPAGASPFGVLDMHGNVSEWVTKDPPLYDPNNPMFRGCTYSAVYDGVSYEAPSNVFDAEDKQRMTELDHTAALVARMFSDEAVGVRCASEVRRP